MKRREWNQFVEFVHNVGIQYGWAFEPRTTMDHAMAHPEHARTAVVRAQPTSERIKRFLPVTSCNILVHQTFTIRILRRQARRRTDAFDLTTRRQMPDLSGWSLKNTELQTR